MKYYNNEQVLNIKKKRKGRKYPFLESVNEDFAVDGESESDTEWLL